MRKCFLLMLFFACIINFFPCVSGQEDNELLDIIIKYDIRIKDVDLKKLIARIDVRVIVSNFPVEADQIIYNLAGLDNPQIILYRNNPGQYQGELFDIDWYVAGMGDMYPFDYYTLEMFTATGQMWYIKGNQTYYGYQKENDLVWINQHNYVADNNSYAVFDGVNRRQLVDLWKTENNVFLPSNTTSSGIFRVHLERFSVIPFFQFVMPLMIAEGVILISAFVYSKPTTEALRIYGIFTSFSPLSMLAIRDFLPHRKTMCIPEFYSIMLFSSSALLIIRHVLLSETYNPKINDKKKMKSKYFFSYVNSVSFLITALLIKFTHNFLINYMYEDQSRFLILVGAANIFYSFDFMLQLCIYGVLLLIMLALVDNIVEMDKSSLRKNRIIIKIRNLIKIIYTNLRAHRTPFA